MNDLSVIIVEMVKSPRKGEFRLVVFERKTCKVVIESYFPTFDEAYVAGQTIKLRLCAAANSN